MRRLADAPRSWRYGIKWRGRWLASNDQWIADSSHPDMQFWPTMGQAKQWRDRHLPEVLDAWAEAIGIFQYGRDVTAKVLNEEE